MSTTHAKEKKILTEGARGVRVYRPTAEQTDWRYVYVCNGVRVMSTGVRWCAWRLGARFFFSVEDGGVDKKKFFVPRIWAVGGRGSVKRDPLGEGALSFEVSTYVKARRRERSRRGALNASCCFDAFFISIF